MDIPQAIAALEKFRGKDLTRTLGDVETSLLGLTANNCTETIATCGAGNEVWAAASVMKSLAGQINVVIHALGILLCLPRLLDPGEAVQYLSLGAGNTGRKFDLETNQRVAEFKFIRWQGGSESIRQNALFKDFYFLAEHGDSRRKYLYVLGTDKPLKFFNGGRALSSVLSGNVRLRDQFLAKFGSQYQKVRDYYTSRRDVVIIQDVSPWVPELSAEMDDDEV